VKRVVAALIESNGKLLACQRRRGDTFELLWEFPGGKIEPGELPQTALARELDEELGATAEIGPELYRTQHQYDRTAEPLELTFFVASVAPESLENRVFEKIEWREPSSLRELDFLPADRDLIELLASGKLRLPGAHRARRKTT
jgi:8-oxo-dGTP diphosphatase